MKMPKLLYNDGSGLIEKKICDEVPYVLLGRHDANEIQILDPKVSRFHAMIFKKNRREFYMLNYGLRDIICRDMHGKEVTADSLLIKGDFQKSKVFSDISCVFENESGSYLQDKEVIEVPKIPGFVEHGFKEIRHLQPIIDAVNDSDGVEFLCSCGVRLENHFSISILYHEFFFEL